MSLSTGVGVLRLMATQSNILPNSVPQEINLCHSRTVIGRSKNCDVTVTLNQLTHQMIKFLQKIGLVRLF
jgi:hypothetical protein